MQCELRIAREDVAAEADALRARVPTGSAVAADVAAIIAAVEAEGDAAVRRYTQRFDCPGLTLASLEVPASALTAAVAALAPELRGGLELASANVRAVAEGWGLEPRREVDLGSHTVALRREPVERAAIYVPGGRAPYPSTVVMGVVTARAAGVRDVVVCSPPRSDGEIDPVVLGACALTGASTVLRMGGVQAVAALALGTDSVPPVDVIVGPGNLYVQEAKRQLSDRVGIDGFAGPSDLVLIADGSCDPQPLALDLLAQAEHGPATLVVAISTASELLDAIANQLSSVPDTGAIAVLVQVSSAEQALALAQALAPEHLQLAGPQAEALAPSATHAGCLFVGERAGTAFGDYVAGSNHVLPTGGTARFSSGLGPANFQRSFAEVRIRDAAPLAQAGTPLARAESFDLHAQSMQARIRDNGPAADKPGRIPPESP